MKKTLLAGLVLLVLALAVSFLLSNPEAKWSGVDDAVVKKFADQAGRPPRDPFINTGQGDMLLFVFLVAGAVGGFIGGYYYRELFPPGSSRVRDTSNV
jgi:ABC-type cobalt transport system substrate-binding protein